MTPEIRFEHPFGTLNLRRWPRRRQESLRAWDGADRYLLEYASEAGLSDPSLVLNDTCGALALSLPRVAASSGDSWVARQAMLDNAADNGIEQALWCWPAEPLPGAGAALMRVPKDLALLEVQLHALNQALGPGKPVVLAGMDKHLPATLLQTLGRYMRQPVAGRGRHKARLFFAETSSEGETPAWPRSIAVLELSAQLSVHAGVFASDTLDIGARFFLQHIPGGASGRIADLGCGNGVVGLAAGLANPGAQVWFCDESAQAIRSTQENAARLLPDRAHFHHGNGLDGLDQQFDLILLNPPFHRGHAVDEGVAHMLFRHARRHLAPGGELRVIGNRHLGYHVALRRVFDQVDNVAANARFVILRCSNNK